MKYETGEVKCGGTCIGLEKPEDLVSGPHCVVLTNSFPPSDFGFLLCKLRGLIRSLGRF